MTDAPRPANSPQPAPSPSSNPVHPDPWPDGHRPHGRHDRLRLPPPREAAGRVRPGRVRDGVVGGARARHRPLARVPRVHRRRAAGLDPDLRRRPRAHGRGRAGRRIPRRRHRRRQHGLPGAEDREAQRRLQPDARARARGRHRLGHGEGGEDPRHREDARGLERARGERARTGAHGRGRRGVGGRRARPHRRAGLSRAGRLGAHRARRRRP